MKWLFLLTNFYNTLSGSTKKNKKKTNINIQIRLFSQLAPLRVLSGPNWYEWVKDRKILHVPLVWLSYKFSQLPWKLYIALLPNQLNETSLKATVMSKFFLPITVFYIFKEYIVEKRGSLYQSYLKIYGEKTSMKLIINVFRMCCGRNNLWIRNCP